MTNRVAVSVIAAVGCETLAAVAWQMTDHPKPMWPVMVVTMAIFAAFGFLAAYLLDLTRSDWSKE